MATIHDGYANTDLRHIHAICLVQGRISKAEFEKLKTLWQFATAEVRLQRRSRDRFQERRRTRFLTQARVLYHSPPAHQRYRSQVDSAKESDRRGKAHPMQHGCNSCGDLPPYNASSRYVRFSVYRQEA